LDEETENFLVSFANDVKAFADAIGKAWQEARQPQLIPVLMEAGQ
jgi:hypothetical protein